MTVPRLERHGPRLLLITGLWPTPDAPSAGIFVRRRAGALESVVVAAPRSYHGPTVRRYAGIALRAFAARGPFDGVEVHWLFPTGLIGLITARLRRVPLVVYAHGDDVKVTPHRSRLHRWLVRLILMSAAAVVTNSRDTASHIQRMGAEATIIAPGVDLARFRPSPRPKERRVLFLGGRTPGKGFSVARGLAHTLVGPGIDERTPDEIPALMAAHDVVLMPSDDESFGVVAIEAMASGRWVVASAVGGLSEVITDGVNGTLVSDGDFRGALARIPDYDPFAVAASAAPFSAAAEAAAFESLWDRLVSQSESGQR